MCRPSRPEHPKEMEALSPSKGGPTSLHREAPKVQRGTFRLCAVTLNQGQTDARLGSEDSPVGRGGAGDREGARPGLSVASPSWNLQGHGEIQLGFPRA